MRAKLRSDCAIFMRVCMFNRAYDGPAGNLWRRLATGRGCWLARVWADRWPAARRSASDWWAKAGKAGDDGR